MYTQLLTAALLLCGQAGAPANADREATMCVGSFLYTTPIVVGQVESVSVESPPGPQKAGLTVVSFRVDEVLRGGRPAGNLRLRFLQFDSVGENVRMKLYRGWVAVPPKPGMRACVFLVSDPATDQNETMCVLDLDQPGGEAALVDLHEMSRLERLKGENVEPLFDALRSRSTAVRSVAVRVLSFHKHCDGPCRERVFDHLASIVRLQSGPTAERVWAAWEITVDLYRGPASTEEVDLRILASHVDMLTSDDSEVRNAGIQATATVLGNQNGPEALGRLLRSMDVKPVLAQLNRDIADRRPYAAMAESLLREIERLTHPQS